MPDEQQQSWRSDGEQSVVYTAACPICQSDCEWHGSPKLPKQTHNSTEDVQPVYQSEPAICTKCGPLLDPRSKVLPKDGNTAAAGGVTTGSLSSTAASAATQAVGYATTYLAAMFGRRTG